MSYFYIRGLSECVVGVKFISNVWAVWGLGKVLFWGNMICKGRLVICHDTYVFCYLGRSQRWVNFDGMERWREKCVWFNRSEHEMLFSHLLSSRLVFLTREHTSCTQTTLRPNKPRRTRIHRGVLDLQYQHNKNSDCSSLSLNHEQKSRSGFGKININHL